MYEPLTDWKQLRRVEEARGYARVYVPSHPASFCNGWVYEHRLAAERMLGRLLVAGETVHHKGAKNDNRPNMIEVLSVEEHQRRHFQRPMTAKTKLQPNWVSKRCKFCNEIFWGAKSTIERRSSCSRQCRVEHKQQRTCVWCRRQYSKNLGQGLFCSEECKGITNERLYSCEHCGLTCDTDTGCNHLDRQPRKQYYGPSWKSATVRAVQRAGSRCEFCGEASSRLAVCHIDHFDYFGLDKHEQANSVHNLLALCMGCYEQFNQANRANDDRNTNDDGKVGCGK